jgi:hypothetical protein
MGNVENLVRLFLMERNFSHALHIAKQLVSAEDVPNEKAKKRLEWIEKHTTSSLDANFHIIMAYIGRYGVLLKKTIEIKISSGKWKELEVQDMVMEVNEAYGEIFSIVMDIAKRYSIDIIVKAEKELEIPEIRIGGKPLSEISKP